MKNQYKDIYLNLLKPNNVNHEYLSWFKDKEIKKYITKNKYVDLQSLKNYVKENISKKNCFFFGIFYKKNNKHIGNIKFDNVNKKNCKADLGILIGNKDYRHQGYASQAIKIGTGLLFKKLGIKYFYLGVNKNNISAINVYKNSGFRVINEKLEKITMKKDMNLMNLSSFSLGSAQFGMPYGINNKTKKKVPIKEIVKIISLADKSGFRNIDTAVLYGKAEKTLGKIGVKNFKITSKLPYISSLEIKNIEKIIQRSLKNLRIKSLYSLLIHDSKNINKNFSKLVLILKKFKSKGLIKNLGVSISNFEDLKKVLKNKNIDIIQVPYNMMDQRINERRLINTIKKNNVKIHIRSIFLQGLLFKKYQEIKKIFPKNINYVKKFSKILKLKNIEKLRLFVNFVYLNKMSNQIILGIDSCRQLQKIVRIKRLKKINFPKIPLNFQKKNENLINPHNWQY